MGILDRCVKAAHTQRSHLALSCLQQCRLGTIILKYDKEKKIINKVSYPSFAFLFLFHFLVDSPDSSDGEKSACNAGDSSSIPGLGKIPWRRDRLPTPVFLGFPYSSAGKESTHNVGDLGSIPRLGRSPGEGKGYLLQYSCLENSMDCIVHGVAKSQT